MSYNLVQTSLFYTSPLCRIPFATKTLPTRKKYFRIIFRLPFHDFDFFELILENYPIPIAFVWVVWHYPVGTPVLVKLFFITVTRFENFRINWVMFSWQMVVEWDTILILWRFVISAKTPRMLSLEWCAILSRVGQDAPPLRQKYRGCNVWSRLTVLSKQGSTPTPWARGLRDQIQKWALQTHKTLYF